MNKFTTPDLPYAYDALEPYMDKATMEIHHDKHHAGYTTKLNNALENNTEYFDKTPEEILQNIDQVPEDIRTAVKNNAGGHVHHDIWWQTMRAGQENNKPTSEILSEIEKTWQSWDKFKEEFDSAAMTVFGAGWAWLVLDNGKLIITKTSNQDSPFSLGQFPLFGIDVWEHAYYLKYQNRRNEFVQNFWNVINWEAVNKRYLDNK
jgi:superoxide dismutase, Fe-Mn family